MPDDPRTATTLAYVGASKRVSSRLSNLFHHIWPDMIGVWVMGSDRSDRERVLYGDGAEVTSAAGTQPIVTLAADTDLELVAILCSRQDGILDGRIVTEAVVVAPGNLPPFRTADGAPAGRVLGTTGVVVAAGPPFNSPQRQTIALPICPQILPQGMAVKVFHEGNASTLRVGFFWRAIG